MKVDKSAPIIRITPATYPSMTTEKPDALRSPSTMNDEQIWTTTLDRRYTVTVNRVASYRGELIITEGGKVLHRESVGLMYGALFGPDVSDVALWKEMAINLVDSLNG